MFGKTISLIVAVNKAGYIDNGNGGLPWERHFKSDMEWFREKTMGKIVLMGGKTFDSIGKPLPGRINVVLSKSGTLQSNPEDALYVCKDFNELNRLLVDFEQNNEIVVIGGGQIYNLFRPYYSKIHITEVLKNNVHGSIRLNYPPNGNVAWAVAERKSVSDELRFTTLVPTFIPNTPKFVY